MQILFISAHAHFLHCQPESITTLWPVTHYTAWRQRHMCLESLPDNAMAVSWTRDRVRHPNHCTTKPLITAQWITRYSEQLMVLLTNQPPYLRNLLHIYHPSCCLCPASQNLLCIPSHTTNFSRRSFSFSTPTIWNELPTAIRESKTLAVFKCWLKTHVTSLTTLNVQWLRFD